MRHAQYTAVNTAPLPDPVPKPTHRAQGMIAQMQLDTEPQTRLQYMLRPYYAQLLLDSQREQEAYLHDQLTRTAGDVRTMSRSQGQPQRDQELAAQLADLRRSIDQSDLQLAQVTRETEALINQVRYPLMQMILRCRYLYHMPMTQVAQHISYSLRHTMRLHDLAMQMLNLPNLPRVR